MLDCCIEACEKGLRRAQRRDTLTAWIPGLQPSLSTSDGQQQPVEGVPQTPPRPTLGDMMEYSGRRNSSLFSLKRLSPAASAVEDDLHRQGIIEMAEQLGCCGPGEFNLAIARGLKARLTWQRRMPKAVADAVTLEEVTRVMEGWLAEKAGKVNGDGPALSPRQYRFLQALAALKAFGPR